MMVSKDKIALTMIVKGTKDEASLLAKALKSIHKHVDGIFINVNSPEGATAWPEMLDVCKKYKAEVIETIWEDDFAKARNAIADKVPKNYNWILWLDADDTVKNANKLRTIVKNSGNVDAVYINYLYDFDEYGNPITVHMSARLYRNNGTHRWKGKIHETLQEQRASRTGMTEELEVVHHSSEDRRDASLERNIKLLEKALNSEGEAPDPRTMFYLAGSYIDAGRYPDAEELLKAYVKISGWDEERSQAFIHLGNIAKSNELIGEARLDYLQALAETPDRPEPYIELGHLESELSNFGKALIWLNTALGIKPKLTTLVRNPQSVAYRANLLAAEACVNIGGDKLEDALLYAKSVLKTRPTDKFVKELVGDIEQTIDQKAKLKEIIDEVKKAKKSKKRVREILSNVPEELDDNPLIVQLRGHYEPFKWPEQSIAIYTGEAAIGEWGPWSLKDGIGGSEEAIIRISKHLKALGYKVVVFANVGSKAGDYDGVQWRNHWECQLDDKFDIFVAWRNPFVFDKKIDARKAYIWLHDVMDIEEFTPERLANVNKVMMLSKYHRTCYPNIPDDKIMYSGNGIDPEESEAYDALPRDDHRIVYQSSHVRGLRYLYEIWPEVKKAVPDATLDVYYGWYSYDKINAGNPERMAWKEEMVQLEKSLDGVTDHGKVGQDEVVKAIAGSGIWAYPTVFPEIFCITAVKCQAGGAVPVCTDYAALDEMVQYGDKMPIGKEMTEEKLEEYKNKLIYWLQHPGKQQAIRNDMKAWARTKSWRATAEGWVEDFEL